MSKRKRGTVVIISDSDDAHIPFVTKYLSQKPIIIGSLGILEEEGLSLLATKQGVTVQWKKHELDRVRSVWYRKPMIAVREDLPVASEYQSYCRSAVLTHLLSLYPLLQNVFWISDFYAVQRANSKPLQHSLASQLGFTVPETLFTSDESAAKQFLQNHKVSVIKSLAYDFPTNAKTAKAFFTRKVIHGERISLKGLSVAPAIFEEAIDTDFDIRVTVVGSQVFATKIRVGRLAKKFSKTLDWRAGIYSGNIKYEPFELPNDIAQKCREHVKQLHLQFGAIDLVQDKKGVIYFLENNPNGQWAFIEDATGQPIGKAIASLLEAGVSDK